MKTKTKVILSTIVIVLIIIIGLYLKWSIGRNIHFNMRYKGPVEKIIKQNVKPECLQ
jgi:hypothetical protein